MQRACQRGLKQFNGLIGLERFAFEDRLGRRSGKVEVSIRLHQTREEFAENEPKLRRTGRRRERRSLPRRSLLESGQGFPVALRRQFDQTDVEISHTVEIQVFKIVRFLGDENVGRIEPCL